MIPTLFPRLERCVRRALARIAGIAQRYCDHRGWVYRHYSGGEVRACPRCGLAHQSFTGDFGPMSGPWGSHRRVSYAELQELIYPYPRSSAC